MRAFSSIGFVIVVSIAAYFGHATTVAVVVAIFYTIMETSIAVVSLRDATQHLIGRLRLVLSVLGPPLISGTPAERRGVCCGPNDQPSRSAGFANQWVIRGFCRRPLLNVDKFANFGARSGSTGALDCVSICQRRRRGLSGLVPSATLSEFAPAVSWAPFLKQMWQSRRF